MEKKKKLIDRINCNWTKSDSSRRQDDLLDLIYNLILFLLYIENEEENNV